MNRPRILLADDHTIVAQGLAALLGGDFDLIGTLTDGLALVDAALRLRPDAIVSDITMPGLSGMEALHRLKVEFPEVKLIFLTMHGDAILAAEAMRAGASGYLLKSSAGEELIGAIHEVLRGGIYLAPEIARNVLTAMSEAPQRSRLTPRQREVLVLIVQGKTLKQIATALRISPRTVETHKYEMMQALGLSTTAELIRYAIELERESN